MLKKTKNKKGVMMIELVVVITIITIMLVMTLDSNSGIPLEAKEHKNTTKLEEINDSWSTSDFYILDNAGLLSAYSAKRIAERSKQLDINSKAQIVVETLTSMGGKNIEEYSSSRFRELGLGDKELNNGVLIVVAPLEKVARVEVGYGLEGAIPDGKLGNIIREQGLKKFEEQNFEKGITDIYFSIAKEVEKEYYPSARKGTEGGAGVTVKWK